MYEFALLLNALFWITCVAFFVTRRYASIFHPATFYLAFHGLVFVVRPVIAYLFDYQSIYRAYDFTPTLGEKMTVIFGAMLGLAAFLAAALNTAHAPVRFQGGPGQEIERRLLMKPFVVVALLCGPIATYSLASQYANVLAGANSMIRDAATGIAINTTSNGYFTDAQFMLVSLCAIFAWLLRFRWWSLLPLLLFVLYRASTGARGAFVVAVVSAVLLYLYQRKSAWPSLRAGAILAVLVVAFSTIGDDRGASLRSYLSPQIAGAGPQRISDIQWLEGMDFANLEYFEYLVHVIPGRTGTYGYFLNNLQVFTEPIPRVLWPDKPIGPPIQLYQLFDYGYPIGMTNSLPGEGWAQLGWAGIVIWCGLAGWFFGWVYRKFQRKEHNGLALLAYLLFLGNSIIVFRDGIVLSLLKTNLFVLIPLILMAVLRRLFGIPTAAEIARRLPAPGTDTSGLPRPATSTLPKAKRRKLAAEWNG